MWWLTLGLFGCLYLATCQRGVGWQDSGMFQWRVLSGDYSGKLGLALAHPLYIAAGRALAWISRRHLPLLLNLFSGVGMAVALANLAALCAVVTGKRWIGLAAAAMVGVAHTAWWLSTIAEVYTWSVAGLTAELWLLVAFLRRPRWRTLAGLGLVNGLGLSTHNFALLPLPVYLAVAIVLIARRRVPVWSLAAAGAAYLAGAAPYIAMTVQLAVRGGGAVAAIHSALFGNYAAEVLNAAVSRHGKANAVIAAMNFVNFLIPLAAIGWARFRGTLGGGAAAAIGAITVIEVLFVVRYPVPDQFTFLLPTLVLLGLAAAVGVSAMVDAGRGWRAVAVSACALSIAMPPVFYAAAPRLARRARPGPARARLLPFRDEMRYWLVPWKQDERSAELFAAAALKEAEPDGVILPDSTAKHALVIVQQRDGLAPGVSVEFDGAPLPPYDSGPEAFHAALGIRPLYVVAPVAGYIPEGLLADAEFERAEGHVLYRARWKYLWRDAAGREVLPGAAQTSPGYLSRCLNLPATSDAARRSRTRHNSSSDGTAADVRTAPSAPTAAAQSPAVSTDSTTAAHTDPERLRIADSLS